MAVTRSPPLPPLIHLLVSTPGEATLLCPTTRFTAAPTDSPPLVPTPKSLSQQRHRTTWPPLPHPSASPSFLVVCFFCFTVFFFFMRTSLARYLLNTLQMLSSQPFPSYLVPSSCWHLNQITQTTSSFPSVTPLCT